ncbi:MAG: helix-hairpin-helix domain-containing protein [Bacteroidota bacterium]|nr:hypothetical protein [Odoribacter sp.]MDP3644621.1 helix-hairpin-helix domain-containing protein [Bacteroidota bacterium]
MNIKQLIQDYFTFSRNERRGITILLILIFLMAIANKTIFYFEKPAKINPALFDSARYELGLLNDSLYQHPSERKLFPPDPGSIDLSGQANPDLPELFVFDPNRTSDADFHRLGLSVKQIATIRNYQNKGGSFRSKDDFFKMYGLTSQQKNDLSDYIKIEKTEPIRPRIEPNVEIAAFELNTADSTELESLPGIGDKLSKRIVKYRDLLGGFYSVSQLKEVYGLNEQTLQLISSRLTIDPAKIRKIDWNFADANELYRHPYLRNNLSKQIIKYRSKNGSISNLEVLRDSMILNIDEYKRLKPYF